MHLFDRHRSRWWFFVGAAIGLAFNLGLLPWVEATKLGVSLTTSPIPAAAAMPMPAPALRLDEPTPFDAMTSIFQSLWSLTYDSEDSLLVRTDATGADFFAASKAAIQAGNPPAIDTTNYAKFTVEYQEGMGFPSIGNGVSPDEAFALAGLSVKRWIVAGEISAGGPSTPVSGYMAALSRDGYSSPDANGFTVLVLTGTFDTVALAVADAKAAKSNAPVTDDPAYDQPFIPWGNPEGGGRTNCTEVTNCADRCACEYNGCTYDKRSDYWDDYNTAVWAWLGCSALCLGFMPNVLAVLACDAVCLIMFLAADHFLNNKLQRAYASCYTTYRGCMLDRCNIHIYEQ